MVDKILWHPKLFIGYQLPGNIKQETLEFVRSLPGVHTVSRSKKFISHSTPSWGLDRIDQKELPLDGIYNPEFNGEGVNVFVVDSGLDTQHSQFTSSKRVVRNIYDGYLDFDGVITANNDGVGHGTHCAGIHQYLYIYGIHQENVRIVCICTYTLCWYTYIHIVLVYINIYMMMNVYI